MSVFSAPSFDQHELVVFHEDPASGLRAIIAIHNTALGPATGGCRMFDYASDDAALDDVLRLSRGMTYKSALAGLPYGGGKAVILGDPARDKNRKRLLAMGEFINSLHGRYIGAEDSGTGVADIQVMREKTPYVYGVAKQQRFGGDPSPYTALGVYCGIKAALRYQRGSDDLSGLRIAIQGAGAVGRCLGERLLKDGAEVYVADIRPANLQRVVDLGAKAVPTRDLLSLDVDVLAPCAMGAVLNEDTVRNLSADIVAGAANNQLASPELAETLRERGIVYAPDFVINAGGIIDVYYQQQGAGSEQSERHIEQIGETLTRVLQLSEAEGRSTHAVAESLAEARFRLPPPEKLALA